MKITEKAKANPFIAIMLTIGALAGAATATWAGVGLIDKLHVTEAELLIYDLKAHTFASGQFDELKDEIAGAEIVGKCRWLKSEIRALKDAIYVRQRDGGSPDYINLLKTDLEELEGQYAALMCAAKLA